MTSRSGFVAALAATVVFFGNGPAAAQNDEIGKVLFEQYCVTCHGDTGKGHGPMTEVMSIEAPDLTKLAANNDGEFPMLKVIHIIDGRTGLRGHGGQMPVFGSMFMAENLERIGINASVLETRGRTMSLAMYLETIQE